MVLLAGVLIGGVCFREYKPCAMAALHDGFGQSVSWPQHPLLYKCIFSAGASCAEHCNVRLCAGRGSMLCGPCVRGSQGCTHGRTLLLSSFRGCTHV
jgi:hypothetical protein